MKRLPVLMLFFILGLFQIEALSQTYADLPGPQNVLVVYNLHSDTSLFVANYYKNARNIQTTNILALDSLFDLPIVVDGETHIVAITQETDAVVDTHNDSLQTWVPTFHAWQYYLERIARQIKNYITSHNLTNQIRYIVLCKGIPFRIQAILNSGNWGQGNVTVESLLCMLGNDNYDTFIKNSVYRTYLSNPYYGADPLYTMNFRFLPNTFGSGHKLSYLVSHLDGISYDVVKGMIDRSVSADKSGNNVWAIDDDPNSVGTGDFILTRDKMISLGFDVLYNSTDEWITSSNKPVMGYTSNGTHAEDHNCFWEDSTWVMDLLNFPLANGSIFNTYESFNGNSLTTLVWRHLDRIPPACNHTQGLSTQFTQKGGTATLGHAWEPYTSTIVRDSILFPLYGLGYNLVDAVYMAMPNLAAENMVVGDPLTLIADYKKIIVQHDTTFNDDKFVGSVSAPANVTVTLGSSFASFKKNFNLAIAGKVAVNAPKLELLNLSRGFIGTMDIESYNELDIRGSSNINIDSLNADLSKINVHNRKLKITDSGKLTSINFILRSSDSLVVQDNGSFTVSGSFLYNAGAKILLKDAGKFTVNSLNMSANDTIILQNSSVFTIINDLIFNTGSVIIVRDNAELAINNLIYAGNQNLKLEGNGKLTINNKMTILPNSGFNLVNSQKLKIKKFDVQNNSVIQCSGSSEFACTDSVTIQSGSNILISGSASSSLSNLTAAANTHITLNNDSRLSLINNIVLPSEPVITANMSSDIILINCAINAGSILNFNDQSILILNSRDTGNNHINIIGTAASPVRFNFDKAEANVFVYLGPMYNALFEHCIFNNASFAYSVGSETATDGNIEQQDLVFRNVSFSTNSHTPDIFNLRIDVNTPFPPSFTFENCTFNAANNAIYIKNSSVDYNFWGNHPVYGYDPAQRFYVRINLEKYFTQPCTYFPSDEFVVEQDASGSSADTIYSAGMVSNQLNETDALYAEANSNYYGGNYAAAKANLLQVINSNPDERKSLKAYTGIFPLEKLHTGSEGSFGNLQNIYEAGMSGTEDTVIYTVLEALRNNCLVEEKKYDEAITNYNTIIQNNPNTDKAFYAELSIIAVEMLKDTTSGLGKKSAGCSIDELIESKYNGTYKSTGTEIIPAEYALAQNYPNPFNPLTNIKYDIPKQSYVTIKIYDILGSEVATLVNEVKQPGKYTVQFNASKYASGVYLYRIQTDDFTAVKKMMLIK